MSASLATTATFELTPRGPYSLAASAAFLEGFTPASHPGARDGHLHLAFVADGGELPVGVCVREGSGRVTGEVAGRADSAVVAAQVGRILSLDLDGGGYAEVGRRDPVVARLQASYPGLRPVLFWSPYEAAAWALLSHRLRMTQAAGLKRRIAERLGHPVQIHGDTLHAFPAPGRLARLDGDGVPGLPDAKLQRLRALGEAALAGRLDAARLRAVPAEQALAELRRLPGVGDFSAELILLRGAGEPDWISTHEPRLRHAVALAYGLERDPDDARLRRVADAWRPFRTWVSVLIRSWFGQGAPALDQAAQRRMATPT
jgi:DNA-3-methyladenine glycosylase II